jgi:hypothetical protein
MANKSDAVNPAIALRFQCGYHWRGVTDPERSAAMRLLTAAILLPLLATFLGGCSKGNNLTQSGSQLSGDLATLVLQCATNRGGRLPGVTPPAIHAQWTLRSLPMQDIIVISGDHFSEVQAFLQQVYGAPDPRLVRAVGNGQSITYTPQQTGVVLNLTGDGKQTIVSVMGMQKPR